MSGLCERVTLDVSFVIGTEEKGSWRTGLSVARRKRRIKLTIKNNIG
jgi:hypothetical protein